MNRIAPTLALAIALGTASPEHELSAASQRVPQDQDPVMTAIAAAAEIPPLENIVLPPGHREIRVRRLLRRCERSGSARDNSNSEVIRRPNPLLGSHLEKLRRFSMQAAGAFCEW